MVGLSFTIGVALGALFGFLISWVAIHSRPSEKEVENNISSYIEASRRISDSIALKEHEVEALNKRLDTLDKENAGLKKQLSELSRKNEEVSNAIVSGSLDDNVLFLTEYLSEKTSLSE